MPVTRFEDTMETIMSQLKEKNFLDRLCIDSETTEEFTLNGKTHYITGSIIEKMNDEGDIDCFAHEFYLNNDQNTCFECITELVSYYFMR